MSDAVLFDRPLLRLRRDRAAHRLDDAGFLFRETAARVLDRLEDTTRHFGLALDIGCHGGELADAMKFSRRIDHLIQADMSPGMAMRAASRGPAMVADEEMLPVKAESLDLVLSNLSLHWVNDLPGALIQIRRALKPDGLFLGCMLGGETLIELRHCLMEAEIAQENGASPRVSPFADVKDAGALMQRAGFALPVVDADTITVDYPNALKLMRDLSAMGESNAVAKRRKGPMNRRTLAHAAALYAEKFARPDGRVTATFQAIFLTGWAPDASQPKPLAPGSGQVSLTKILASDEGDNGQ